MNSNVPLPEEPVDVPLPRSSALQSVSMGHTCRTGSDKWAYAIGGAIIAALVVLVSLYVQKYLLASVPKSSKLPVEVGGENVRCPHAIDFCERSVRSGH